MIKTGQKILIACDSSKSLIDFRGKLIEKMAKMNNVSVFTPAITDQRVRDILNSLNVNVYENKLTGSKVSVFADLKYIFRLFILLMKVKPDIFFPYTFKPVIYGTFLAKLCRIKMITPMLTGLGYNFAENAANSFVKTITRLMLKLSLLESKRLKIIFQNKTSNELSF